MHQVCPRDAVGETGNHSWHVPTIPGKDKSTGNAGRIREGFIIGNRKSKLMISYSVSQRKLGFTASYVQLRPNVLSNETANGTENQEFSTCD